MAQRSITEKQRRFAQEYLVDLNATQAAIRAGYSPKTAGSQAFDLLKKPEIQEIIEQGRKAAEVRTGISLDRVLEAYAAIAFGGMSRFVRIDHTGAPQIDLSQCTPEDLDLLAEIQTDRIDGGEQSPPVLRIKIKQLDRLNALEKLARHLGAFKGKEDSPLEDALSALIRSVQGTALPVASRSGSGDA